MKHTLKNNKSKLTKNIKKKLTINNKSKSKSKRFIYNYNKNKVNYYKHINNHKYM